MTPDGAWQALLSIGSNIDARANGRAIEAALRGRFEAVRISPWFECPAEGGSAGQADFLNFCVALETDLPPRALREVLRALEWRAGRRRTADRFAPRPLDLDLVHARAPDGGVPVCHPDLAEHAYVLVPAAVLAPDLVPIAGGPSLAELAKALPPSVHERLRHVPRASSE